LRSQGFVPKQDPTRQKLKEQLLRKMTPPCKSTQNTKNKFGNVVTKNNTSPHSKRKFTTPKVSDKATSPNTSKMLDALDYNIVEDMKEYQGNILISKLTRITSQLELLLQALCKPSSGSNPSLHKGPCKSSGPMKLFLNAFKLEANTLYPPFLLTLKIFNYNVHNYLVDSGASINVMSLSISKKINAKWDNIDAHII